jgi:glycosyltransferase involved in cell wall biosynthesis
MHKRVFYLPHGVEGDTIKTKYNLKKLMENKKNLIAIYLGEQSRYKQVDKIITAVKNQPCDLFLFGAINKELLPLKTKNVHFMGYANPREVPSLLKQADILVNTSDQDSNFKFFEYIRAGKPILAFAGRPRFLFEHGKTAYLTKDFSSGLKELISNAKLRRVLEHNVKKMKTFSWEEIADKYLELIEKVIHPWNS